GSDRFETAARLTEGRRSGVETVYVTAGTGFPDALAATARAAHEGAPLLVVRPDAVPESAARMLQALSPQRIVAIGAPGVLSEDVRWSREPFLRCPAPRGPRPARQARSLGPPHPATPATPAPPARRS